MSYFMENLDKLPSFQQAKHQFFPSFARKRIRKLPGELEGLLNDPLKPYLLEAVEEVGETLDSYQLEHVLSVTERVLALSEKLNLGEEGKNTLLEAALVHDVGKARDEELAELVTSSDKLTPEQRQKIKEHLPLTIDWCKRNGVPERVMAVVGRHHETNGNYRRRNGERRKNTSKSDGTERRRNRDRRRGELNNGHVDRQGKILELVDTYDSLRNERSYKPSYPADKCARIMRENGCIVSQEDEKVLEGLIDSDKN